MSAVALSVPGERDHPGPAEVVLPLDTLVGKEKRGTRAGGAALSGRRHYRESINRRARVRGVELNGIEPSAS